MSIYIPCKFHNPRGNRALYEKAVSAENVPEVSICLSCTIPWVWSMALPIPNNARPEHLIVRPGPPDGLWLWLLLLFVIIIKIIKWVWLWIRLLQMDYFLGVPSVWLLSGFRWWNIVFILFPLPLLVFFAILEVAWSHTLIVVLTHIWWWTRDHITYFFFKNTDSYF